MEEQIKATIESCYQHVRDAYDKLESMGATMPSEKNIENLRPTIYTLDLDVDKYQVTFDDGQAQTVEEVFAGQLATKPVDPVQTGKKFLYWYEHVGPAYDPNNPTLTGLKAALNAGDYNAFPVGTVIPDTYNGHSNPLTVAQYLNSSNNSQYYGSEGVILVRKYVEPTSMVWYTGDQSSTDDYRKSDIRTFLDTDYYNNCSQEAKDTLSDISITTYISSEGAKNQISAKWFLMSTTEIGGQAATANGIFWDYWKQKTGLSSGNNNSNSGRVGYNTSNGSAAWWTRSSGGSGAIGMVNTSGAVTVFSQRNNSGVLPACFIGKDN